jgi:hypothetical protein
MEDSSGRNINRVKDLPKIGSNIHSKNKSETLNMVSEVFPAILETKSDSKRKRSLNFQNSKDTQKSSKQEINNFNQNLPNSSSTELTRGGMTGMDNYASNDPGDTSHSNVLQQNNNFTFELLNSQKLKSQNSISSKFTHKNKNFIKRDILKQSNSHTNEYFTPPYKNKQSLRLPFPMDDKNSTLNSEVYQSRRNSKDFKSQSKDGVEMARVSAHELEAAVLISQNKLVHLKESLNQSRILMKENNLLKRKSKLMIVYMVELGKKLKDTSEICRKMSHKFNEQDKLCMEYKNTLMVFMKKLLQFFPKESEKSLTSSQPEKIEQLISKVNQMLSSQNMHKFQSFLSHQNGPNEGVHLSPQRTRQHIRRTSSMKSLKKKNKSKESWNVANPYNNKSNLLNSEEADESLFVNPLPHLHKQGGGGYGKVERVDLSKSELVKGKRPVKKTINERNNLGEGNMIKGFGNVSNFGESEENFAQTEKTSDEELYNEIMTSENISYHQRNSFKYPLTLRDPEEEEKQGI